MIPIYTNKHKSCNYCDAELYIGYEVVVHDDSIYCNTECLTNEIIDNIHIKNGYLTNDRSFKDE